MIACEDWLLSYLFNSLWQIPLIFAAGWVAARAVRAISSALEHKVWVAVVLLQTLLPACSGAPGVWLRSWGAVLVPGSRGVAAHVTVTLADGIAAGILALPSRLQASLLALYCCVCVYAGLRLLWRGYRLAGLRRESRSLELSPEAESVWQRVSDRFSVYDVSLRTSSAVAGPVTLGVARKLLLLPTGMGEGLSVEDLETILAHEFAHMQRQDFAKNLAYELLAVPVLYHPVAWLTRGRLLETREMICDRMAAEITSPILYTRSLLRLASLIVAGEAANPSHAIGILDANTLERRLMNLNQITPRPNQIRRIAIFAGCALLGIATSGTALALRVDILKAGSPAGQSAASPTQAAVPVDASVIAGNLLVHTMPVYPKIAKDAGVEGSVILHAIIGKDGTMQRLEVVSGPEMLTQSALDAVQHWVYKPYLHDGEPTEVETTITVNYSFGQL